MHRSDGLAAPTRQGVSEAVALQAAHWLMRLQSGQASAAEQADLRQWREADATHELAWQRARRIQEMLGQLPPAVSVPVLERVARMDRRKAAKVLATLLMGPPAAWLAWRAAPTREWMADYRTATGEIRETQLADGTRIWMNTATAFDVVYGATERLVVLHAGEILIETPADAPDPSDPAYRPFIVQTVHGRLQALGTRFVVRRLDEESRVAVEQGAVEVRPARAPDGSVVLHAGRQAAFSAKAVHAQSPYELTPDWTQGVLRVKNLRLDDFLAELGRYRPGVLRCAPAVAGLRISGAFQLSDTDAVLSNLPRVLPIQVRFRTRYWVTVDAADA